VPDLDGIEISDHPRRDEVFTPEATAFVADLVRTFRDRRIELLRSRRIRQEKFDTGLRPDFLPETAEIRTGTWTVAPPPKDLLDRRVEITGPPDRKMMINALNSGAKVFMADFEDSSSPTWDNMMEGLVNVRDAVRRELSLRRDGKSYTLNDETATLIVRPRGWHLPEKHVQVDGRPAAASLVDFGLVFFHTAREALDRGTGPYFYLPKLENHDEARLWNDVFCHAQDALSIPRGSIRATVLIDGPAATMPAPFRGASPGLWAPPCHKRGAHAIGGMAAFIPNRRDPGVTAEALTRVKEDKRREANDGCDGTWVAHPDLVTVAEVEFNAILGRGFNQIDRQRPDVLVSGDDLLAVDLTGGAVTRAGLETNVYVSLRYLASWLSGSGAAAINNLMEDAATAEISRSQVWQWVHHGQILEDETQVTADLVRLVVGFAGRCSPSARSLATAPRCSGRRCTRWTTSTPWAP